MTRRYVYMNEAIKELNPTKPVIVVQVGQRLENTNHVTLAVGGHPVAIVRFVKSGLQAAPLHHVRAFVEVLPGVDIFTEAI